ncbi:MAG: hypothetical protein EXS25_02965 [Pedosphaera sp.]|nr:hypothetical protein [Pedosphaera sp.]
MPPVNRVSLSERFQIGTSLLPPLALLWLGARRGWIDLPLWIPLAGMPLAVLTGMCFPLWFEPWHRGVKRIQSKIGRSIITGLMAGVFLLLVLPIGVFLRITGRRFLETKKQNSYWKPARKLGSLRDGF